MVCIVEQPDYPESAMYPRLGINARGFGFTYQAIVNERTSGFSAIRVIMLPLGIPRLNGARLFDMLVRTLYPRIAVYRGVEYAISPISHKLTRPHVKPQPACVNVRDTVSRGL